MQKAAFHAMLGLFLVVAFSALLVARRFEVPPAPDRFLARTAHTEESSEPLFAAQARPVETFPNLGRRAIFATLIAKPPVTPPPPPPPPPPPSIDKVTADRVLVAILPGQTASFENHRTGEEWVMKVGETRAVKHGTETVAIQLRSVDNETYAVRLSFEGKYEPNRTLKLFEP